MISKLNPDANGAHLARKWSCVWRPDIGSRLYARGSWQAAGGVGGLAWLQTGIAQTVYPYYTYSQVTGNGEVHIPMMDHMGNVRHYYQIKTTSNSGPTSGVSGQITANLDYDAFGREVRATGPKTPTSGQPPGLAPGDPWVDVLPFHFSTKFTDRESGLNYYGFRFYDPVDGRWLNRDPIGEWGGCNVLAFLDNNGLNTVDVLGLNRINSQSGVFCCSCALAKIQLRQILEWARKWNQTSPPWAYKTNECTEQANGLIEHITKKMEVRAICVSMSVVGGMRWGRYLPFNVGDRRAAIGGNQHHVVLVTVNVGGQDSQCPGVPKALILDPFIDKNAKNNPGREVRQETPEEFRRKYPVEDPATPSDIVYPNPPNPAPIRGIENIPLGF